MLDEAQVASKITLYTRVPEGKVCDTMWVNCESPATVLIAQEFNGEKLFAWRCSKHYTD